MRWIQSQGLPHSTGTLKGYDKKGKVTHTPSLFPQSRNSTPGWDVSGLSTHEVNQWWSVIALPLVGMLLLLCCFLLQGVFALLGPWVIFVGVKLITKKLEQQPSC